MKTILTILALLAVCFIALSACSGEWMSDAIYDAGKSNYEKDHDK